MVQSPAWRANWFAACPIKTPNVLTFQVPIFIPLCLLCDVSPRNTPPPTGDPSGGVVYLRIVLSPEQAFRMWMFLNIRVLQAGVVSTSPNPQAGGPPLAGCPQLLIQFIRSYPPYWRPFLYLQSEDAPCHVDRDPLDGFQLLFLLIMVV